MTRRTPAAAPVDRRALLEMRAAIAAGLSVSQALVVARPEGPLAGVARDVRLGRSLGEISADLPDLDPAAVLLVRALAIAETTGSGALAAVDQALQAVREAAELQRLLDVRTADARGSAAVLTSVPVAVWILLAAVNPSSLGVYRTVPGAVAAIVAVGLVAGGWRITQRMVRGALSRAAAADPLGGPDDPSWGKPVAVGAAAAIAAGVLTVPVAGVAAGVVALTVARRVDAGRWRRDRTGGGSAETVELVACGLAAGLPTVAALDTVARLGPDAARPVLTTALRRVRGGRRLDDAFERTPMAPLGQTLDAAQRWGAPADEMLRRLVADMRADRRAAAEKAVERLQLALVFPTTLLTLPAFVLGVVPPLLWSTLA